MLDVLLEALLDSLKMLPFLFGAYLLMEWVEHRAGDRLTHALSRPGALGEVSGVLGGALLGCVPQCGFSVAAANLYAARLISPAALVAVFLSTSDEAVPVLLAHPGSFSMLWRLLAVKVILAVLGGLLTLFLFRLMPRAQNAPPAELCAHCGCERHGIVRGALHHTAEIFLLLLGVNLALGAVLFFTGEDALAAVMLQGSAAQPFVTALVGLIPNCAASVVLTELFVQGSITFGGAVAGLCTGAGLGLVVLFRTNRPMKQNFAITAGLYVFSALAGVLIDLV